MLYEYQHKSMNIKSYIDSIVNLVFNIVLAYFMINKNLTLYSLNMIAIGICIASIIVTFAKNNGYMVITNPKS